MAKITITTSQAIRELKLVIEELKVLKQTSNSVGLDSAKSLKKIETQLNSIKTANRKANKSFKSLETALNKNTIANNRNTASQRSQRIATNQLTSAIYKKIRAEKQSNTTTTKTTSNFGKLLSSGKNLIGLFGVIKGLKIFGNLLLETYDLIKQFDSIDFAMNTLIKRTDQLESSQSFLLDITESYGLEIVSTSQRYLKFLASAQQVNLSLNDTQKIFRSVSKASGVLGLKVDEVNGVYLALEQMLSKGKVTTEELRRQLGERLPGALGIMASALGVTIPELDKMLKKGEVLSSEALPKFAEALEEAYGIESVSKIDTLTASQNRLSNAWKVFRKNVAESNPWMEKSLKWIQNYTSEALKLASVLFGTENFKLQNEVAVQSKQIEEDMRRSTTTVLNAKAKQGERLKELEEKIFKQRIKLSKQFKEKEINKESEILNQLLQKKLEFNKKIKEENINWAQQNIQQTSNQNALLEKEYEDTLNRIEELEEKKREHNKLENIFSPKITGKEVDELNNLKKSVLPKLREEFAESTARLNIFKSLIEETFEKPVPEPEFNTDNFDLAILKLKNNIKDIEAFLKRKDNSQNQQVKATLDLYKEQSKLIEKEFEREIAIAKEKGKNKNIAVEKLKQKEEEILTEYSLRKQKLNEKFFTEEILEIKSRNKQLLDEEKIKLRKQYEKIINPSIEQKKAYNNALSKLDKEYSNKSLKEQSDFIRTWIDTLGLLGEERVVLERKILDLLAKLKTNSNDKDTDDLKNKLENDLQLIGDFINEIGALFDNLSQRKLEAIDKEINAEENRYNKLIDLAEGDALQQEALEEQKQAKIEQLEKKRLKEEQRQAKIRKAFAVSEVAINTAIAVSKVWGQTGIFGIAKQIPVLIMGALQTATILAQPIPQYKDGLENANKDHIAMINDGGQKEYIERDGKILSTDTKNAIVSLKKGDTVYKNKREMMSKSEIYAQRNNQIATVKIERQNLGNEISKQIKEGFKGAKFNNNIYLRNKSGNNYLKEKSRFNG